MACNRADWVRGLARLISSAISNWQKTGPGEAEAAAAVFVLVEDFAAGDVGRHQVGRELHAPGVQAQCTVPNVDQQGFAQPRRADQQRVAAGQDAGQRLVDDRALAVDDAADFARAARSRLPRRSA
jgi:hypothetical protein